MSIEMHDNVSGKAWLTLAEILFKRRIYNNTIEQLWVILFTSLFRAYRQKFIHHSVFTRAKSWKRGAIWSQTCCFCPVSVRNSFMVVPFEDVIAVKWTQLWEIFCQVNTVTDWVSETVFTSSWATHIAVWFDSSLLYNFGSWLQRRTMTFNPLALKST